MYGFNKSGSGKLNVCLRSFVWKKRGYLVRGFNVGIDVQDFRFFMNFLKSLLTEIMSLLMAVKLDIS